MKNNHNVSIIASVLFYLTLSSPIANACSNLNQLQWLVGEWKSSGINQVVMESLEQTSSMTFEGSGFTLSSTGEELGREWLRLLTMKEQIYYLAKVDHNELPIPFLLTHCLEGYFLFQNPQHDFPKQISYQRKNDK